MASYLTDYLSYATDNEAPEMFHVWSAYSALSAAVGRRVWFIQGPIVFYPNIYVLLVGDAGSCKSTAMRYAQDLLSNLGGKNPGEFIHMSCSVETPEAFCKFIGGDTEKDPPTVSKCLKMMQWPNGKLEATHAYHIQANEFLNFISKNDVGWTVTLNDIYDQDRYSYKTKNMGTDIVVGPYITLLGAIPTESSKQLQRVDVISTGFARRTFLQHGERRFDNPKPRIHYGPEQEALRNKCLAHLVEVQKLSGPMKETPEAAAFYDAWYIEHNRTLAKRATPQTKGWLSSKATQVIKLAVLNSLAHRLTREIIVQDYQLGLAYLDELEKGFPFVFGGVGRNDLAPLAMKLLEHLTLVNEPVSFGALKRKFFSAFSPGKGFNELTECMTHLVDSSQVIARSVTTKVPPIIEEIVYATPVAWNAFVDGSQFGQPVVVPTLSPKDWKPVEHPLPQLPVTPPKKA